ncbi:MAG: efflux RND transporter permease subunit [Candidatus Eisenbacteria sp.]|nr:efflux RND transporter permease subunit [Candidatus Eisenbacteria bacterium]
MRFFAFLISNWRVVLLLLVVLPSLVGVMAFVTMPKELNPDIQLPMALVVVPYPGAAPEEVESLITDKLEDDLQGLDDLDDMLSTSMDGSSIITVRFEAGVDIGDAVRDTKEVVSDVERELPEDAMDAEVIELNFSEFPIVVVSMSGGSDYLELTRTAEDLQDEIEAIPDVLEVRIVGGVERVFDVAVDPARMEAAGLTLFQIVQMIGAANINLPGGDVSINDSNFLVRVDSQIREIGDLRDVVVSAADDQVVLLADIADVTDGTKDAVSYSRMEGVPSVSLAIKKRQGTNTISVTEEIKQRLEESRAWLPEGTKLEIIGEQAKWIKDTLSQMKNSAMFGLVMVILVLFAFLGFRNSLIVAIVIPLAIFITFAFLWAGGVSMNTITLFSIVLVVGMIVDNAIVVVENIYRHMQISKRRWLAAAALGITPDAGTIKARARELDAVPDEKIEGRDESWIPKVALRTLAAADGASEVALPILTATLTTIAAFMPMLIMGGVMGEFMGYIPKTVSMALAASFLVAMMVNPVISAKLMRVRSAISRTGRTRGDRLLSGLKGFYEPVIRWSLRRRGLVLLCLIPYVLGALALLAFGVVEVEMFPEEDIGQLYINVEAPQGTRVETTDEIVKRIETFLDDSRWDPYIDTYVANVGYSGASAYDWSFGGSENFGQIVIDLVDEGDRDLKGGEIQELMRPFLRTISGAEVDFQPIESGPPTDAPVVVKIIGDDMDTLRDISRQVQDVLGRIPGAVDVKDDFGEGSPEIVVRIDQTRAALLGVSAAEVAMTVRTAVYGVDASQVRKEGKDIDIWIRLAEEHRSDLSDIAALKIPTHMGDQVLLGEIATIETGTGVTSIRHIDTERVVRVTASAAPGIPAVGITNELRKTLDGFPLPPGYRFSYSGDFEMMQESFQSLGEAFIIAVILIYVLMVAQFQSLLQPVVILSTIPFAIFGALYGLAIGGQMFALVSLIGVVGLSGVVVNAAILLVDYINAERRRGRDTTEALVAAGLVRLRPILLSAVTTMAGLLPLTVAEEGWRPLGFTFIFGLGFASILTLVVLPVIYSLVHDLRMKLKVKVGFLNGEARKLVEEKATDF